MEGTDLFHTTMILTHLLFVATLRGNQSWGAEAACLADKLCPAPALPPRSSEESGVLPELAANQEQVDADPNEEGPTAEDLLAQTPLRRILALSQSRPSGSFVAALVIGQLSQRAEGGIRCQPKVDVSFEWK